MPIQSPTVPRITVAGGAADSVLVKASADDLDFAWESNKKLIADGTSTGNVLYWNGSAWVEEDAITITPAGAVTLDYNAAQAFATGADSINIYGTSGDNPFLSFYQDDLSTRNMYISSSGAGDATWTNEIPAKGINIRARNTGNTAYHTGFYFLPDGSAYMYYNNSLGFNVISTGGQLFSSVDDYPTFTAYQDDKATPSWSIGYAGVSTTQRWYGYQNGIPWMLQMENNSGSAITGINFDPDSGIAFNGSAAVAKQSVTGSRGGNAALASFLTAMATCGLIIDNTTA